VQEISMRTPCSHRDVIVSDLDDAGQLPWLERRGVELIRGCELSRRQYTGTAGSSSTRAAA